MLFMLLVFLVNKRLLLQCLYLWRALAGAFSGVQLPFFCCCRPCVPSRQRPKAGRLQILFLYVSFYIFLGLCFSSFALARLQQSSSPNLYIVLTYNLLGSLLLLLVALFTIDSVAFLYNLFACTVKRNSLGWPPALGRYSPPPKAGKHRWNRCFMRMRLGFAVVFWVTTSGFSVDSAYDIPAVRRLSVPLANLPGCLDGYTLAVAGDAHAGPLVGATAIGALAVQLGGLGADAAVLVGDFGDGPVVQLEEAMAPLQSLASGNDALPDGAFFVTGNHEYISGDADKWRSYVSELGIFVLDNTHIALPRPASTQVGGKWAACGGDVFDLAGSIYPPCPLVSLAHFHFVQMQA